MILARGVIVGLMSALPVAAPAQEFGTLVSDTPTRTANIEVVCTGVGLDARQNPAWADYPLKIEVAGRGGQYLGDVHLSLSQKDKTLATLTCAGPWILFRVPTGRYQVEAKTEDRTVSSGAFVPAAGQGRIILRFPELGGAMSPPPTGEMKSSSQPAGQ
jgi:hypothetical protein